jgi:hypothetical protein
MYMYILIICGKSLELAIRMMPLSLALELRVYLEVMRHDLLTARSFNFSCTKSDENQPFLTIIHV